MSKKYDLIFFALISSVLYVCIVYNSFVTQKELHALDANVPDKYT